MARNPRHLLDRQGRYSARLTVPVALRDKVGKQELLEPLGADRVIALRKLPAAVGRMQAILEEARGQAAREKQRSAQPRKEKPLTVRQMALAHYNDQLAFDNELRNSDSRFAWMGFHDENRIDELERVQRGSSSDDEMQRVVGWILTKFIRKGHTSIDAGSPKWRELARALATAELESIVRTMERDESDFIGTPQNPLLIEQPEDLRPATSMLSDRIIGPDSTKSLTEILPQFLNEKKPKPGTANEYRVAVRMFEEFFEDARPVHAIARQDVLAYKRALLKTPTNYVKRFEGATLPEAIKRNEARAQPFDPLNPTTINDKWLSRLRSLLSWCADNGIIPDSPAVSIKVDAAAKAEKPRIDFKPNDLSKIFATPLFARGVALTERHWALLIALHQGFRASEIAQIKLDSIRHARGILVFEIEEETKNLSSIRVVPVHSTLIRLGLAERLAALRNAGETHCFPEWFAQGQALKERADEAERTVNQTFSQFIPRWFNRTYLPSVGVINTRLKFHSFRHTLKTALSMAGVSREISNNITGHDDTSAAAGYIHDVSIEKMKSALESVHFDGLDFSALDIRRAEGPRRVA